MSKEEAQGANEGAFARLQWNEGQAAANTKGSDMKALHGGAACCEHTGYPQHLVESIKKGRALVFGRVKPEEQMADLITVGPVGSSLPKCEVCTEWRLYKGEVPRFRSDGTIYQTDQRSNGEVPDDTIPEQLSGSTAPSAESSIAPTPRSFAACPSEYHFDPMDYTDTKELEESRWQDETGAQLTGKAEEADDIAASEQLQRYRRLWESATPEGSPGTSLRGSEVEERIVYEEGRGGSLVVEWVRKGL